jgi:photosystem II stability/assembly factor-like uncharacterized protein
VGAGKRRDFCPLQGERTDGPAHRRAGDTLWGGMRWVIRSAVLAVACGLCAGALAQSSTEEGVLPAEPARLAVRSLLLDIARAGKRLVAVGERGHVLLSDDDGRSWKQAELVPTQALLTAVCFSDERVGIAVGHDEIILRTTDGGQTWERKRFAPEAQQPLLDVWCGEGGQVIAIGAYSVYFVSTDGGETWRERKFEAASRNPESSSDEEDEFATDYHLNGIAGTATGRLYIAAEAGHLYRSDDAGATWIELPSPYEGSFFGVLPLSADEVLAFGLRGNLYASKDAGLTWRKVDTGTVAMLNDGVRLEDGRIAIVGLSGVILVSQDGGQTFELRQQDDRKGLSAVVEAAPGELAVVGENGVRLVSLGEAMPP